MLSLNAIRLKGFATFKDVEFRIQPGLTAIYGLNRAAGKASKNRNGVGKSALFASIPEIIHDEPIVGEKMDRSPAELKELEFLTNNGKRVQISRAQRGRGEAFAVTIDGRPQKFLTPTKARQFIRRAFPISVEDYNTYVHIDSRIPHPLVMGNSASRKRFFTKFFGLDKIDAERKLYVAELNKLKRIRSAFDELRVQYDRVKNQLLTEEQVQKYTRLEAKFQKRIQVLQREHAATQNTMRLLQFAEASADQIKALQVACQGDISVKEFQRAVRDNQLDLEDAQKKLEDAEAWELYQRDNQAYVEAMSKISPGTTKLLTKYGLERLKDRASKGYTKQMELRVELSDLAKKMSLLKDKLEGSPIKKVQKPSEDEGDLETLRRAYKHQLEHASKFKRGKCETCGQIVKVKDPQVLKDKLEQVVRKLNQHRRYQAYVEDRNNRRSWKIEWRALKTKYDELSVQERALDKWVKIRKEVMDLPKQPRPFKGLKLQANVCRLMVEELKERRSLLTYMKPHLDMVLELQQLTKADIKRAQQSESLLDELEIIRRKWSSVQTKLEVHRTFKDQARDIRARLVKMKAQLKDEQPLIHLVKGYQDKNLKKMAIEAISERLMVLVNRFAQQVFPERFTFEFKWDTQIRLLVHRHHGKKIKTSDVRRLSGAESTFFTLVLVCALLAFVPDSKRCNVLILDEPAARLSDELKETFKNLLGILNSLIPSIVVITPHTEIYEGARCYTVVKNNQGVATIVEGHPTQIR